jgi:hypothetical protein
VSEEVILRSWWQLELGAKPVVVNRLPALLLLRLNRLEADPPLFVGRADDEAAVAGRVV